MSALVVPGLVVQTLDRRWGPDALLHLAVLRSVLVDPWAPPHPVVATGDPTAYWSPLTVGLGIGGGLLGVGPVGLMWASAAVALVVLGVGLWRFTVAVTGRPEAVPLAVVFVLFAWGMRPVSWSGSLDVGSLGAGLAYPATLAVGVSLVWLASLARYLEEPRWGRGALLAVGAGLVVLVHPFSGLWLVVGAAAFVARRPRRAGALVTVVVGAAVIVSVWPWYPWRDLISSAPALTDIHRDLYVEVLPKVVLAAPGVVALLLRLRRERRDPLALMFLLAAGLYLVGGVVGRYELGRALPIAMVATHVALADLVARMVDEGRRTAAAVIVVPVVVLGVVGSLPGWVRMLPGGVAPVPAVYRQPVTAPYRILEGRVSGAVVLATEETVRRAVPAFGGRTVAPGFPMPLLRDAAARAELVTRFVDPATSPSERTWILSTSGARFVATAGAPPPEVIGDLRPVVVGPGVALYAVDG